MPALGSAPAQASARPRCDPIDPARCLFPWPNDYFTRRDPTTPTGRRLALTAGEMPRNKDGVPINPRDYDFSDGFSPGQAIITKVPGLDTPAAFARTGAVPVNDIGRAFDRRQPIVVINARTLKRQLIWAELDARATSPASTALLIHPGVNFKEGQRYIVALRNLRDARGHKLRPSHAFRVLRDRLRTRSAALRHRRPHFERLFKKLRRAGIRRHSLYLAWDFTIASRRSLSSRLLDIRNRAFRALGDTNLRDLKVTGRVPAYTVDSVKEYPSGPVLREVHGHVTVPCFLDKPGCPAGSRFKLSRGGLPIRTPGNNTQAAFICVVPRAATPSNPAIPVLFGHGLFQDASAVLGGVGTAFSIVNGLPCAADFTGLTSADLPNVANVTQDLSNFPTIPDRLQQSLIDFTYLGRLMIHPRGFAANPLFQSGGRSVIGASSLAYLGASLGGIEGGALTSIAPDFTRAALVVPGMNFSLLLPRSTQADPYFTLVNPAYPDGLIRPLVLSMTEILWERGEANAYAWHLTSHPYANTPLHHVMLHEAFGDHQVANVATETEARTIGAALRTPVLDPGRSLDKQPFYGIPRIKSFPFHGTGLSVWDIGPLRPAGCGVTGAPACKGTTPAPLTNTPNRSGVDPHPITAFEPLAAVQFLNFLKPNGAFTDVCDSHPCYAAGWTGP
jgi:hypothetical protein